MKKSMNILILVGLIWGAPAAQAGGGFRWSPGEFDEYYLSQFEGRDYSVVTPNNVAAIRALAGRNPTRLSKSAALLITAIALQDFRSGLVCANPSPNLSHLPALCPGADLKPIGRWLLYVAYSNPASKTFTVYKRMVTLIREATGLSSWFGPNRLANLQGIEVKNISDLSDIVVAYVAK